MDTCGTKRNFSQAQLCDDTSLPSQPDQSQRKIHAHASGNPLVEVLYEQRWSSESFFSIVPKDVVDEVRPFVHRPFSIGSNLRVLKSVNLSDLAGPQFCGNSLCVDRRTNEILIASEKGILVLSKDLEVVQKIETYTDTEGTLQPFDCLSNTKINRRGRIVVNDYEKKQLLILSRDSSWRLTLESTIQLPFIPLHSTVDQDGNYVVFGCQKEDQIIVLSEDGQLIRKIKFSAGIWSLAVLSDSSIVAVNGGDNSISILSPDGKQVSRFGERGTGNGEFDFPSGVCVDSCDKIIVSDTYNDRLQVFSRDGTFIQEFGKNNHNLNGFAHPRYVEVDRDGNIIVVDVTDTLHLISTQ